MLFYRYGGIIMEIGGVLFFACPYFFGSIRTEEMFMRCALCGKMLSGKLNTDHIFPRAVYKWLENLVSPAEYARLYVLIESDENKIFVHRACNLQKQDALPRLSDLCLPEEKRAALTALSSQLSDFTATYAALKARLIEAQNGACFSCGRPLTGNGVLRRIDPAFPRTERNACIVCGECNEKYPDFKSK